MGNAYIVDACRTPRGIGKVGKGALAHLHPSYLGSTVLAAMAERNNLNTAEVDDIIWGTSSQTGKQGGDLGRMAALNAGLRRALFGCDAGPFLRLGHYHREPRLRRRSCREWKIW
jgi:acetyl-CoA acetyltransferase